jgi:hypothetical protein
VWGKSDVYKILIGKAEEKSQLRRPVLGVDGRILKLILQKYCGMV